MPWPLYPLDEIVDAVNRAPAYVQRTCISMITNRKCRNHTVEMARRLSRETHLPVSVLISPTILDESDLLPFEGRRGGQDRRGPGSRNRANSSTPTAAKAVSGPHQWEKYWQMIEAGLRVFGRPNVGAHLMVGMGETKQEMVSHGSSGCGDMGVLSHLFSFFAEKGLRPVRDAAAPLARLSEDPTGALSHRGRPGPI